MSSQYYTASEARTKLGLTKAMFHKKVRQGLIPKVVVPGKSQAMYPKRDIDALAMSATFEADDIVFSRSTPADQIEELHIGIRCFGHDFMTPLSERIAFQQKNVFTFHSLKVRGQVVGYISMFRLPENLLEDLLTGRRIEREITTRDVLPFERLQPFSVYIDVIAIDPALSLHLRHLYAGMMIFYIIDTILTLLANDYQMTSLYTVTTTRDGDNLVKKIGFRPMPEKEGIAGRLAYEYALDLAGRQRLQRLQQVFRRHLQM